MLRLIPAILSALLLAAHFLRDGQLMGVVICLCLPLLLIPRQRQLLRLLQGIYILGAIEWLWTLHRMVQLRLVAGEPWLRLVAILGAVAAFTLATAWWLRRWPLKHDVMQEPENTA